MNYEFILLGAVDGMNVCNLSLMVLFMSLAYSSNMSRRQVILLGTMFIVSVFVAYLLIGVGILALTSSGEMFPHLLARVAAAILLFVRAVNVLHYFRPHPRGRRYPVTCAGCVPYRAVPLPR